MNLMSWERNLNALLVVILSGVLLGGFCVQFLIKEDPCPLCLLQRVGMIGVAAGAFLNLQFGVRMAHYALALLSALMGAMVALRHILLHICPGSPAFGEPVLGLSLYTWSFLVFVCSMLAITSLLFLYEPRQSQQPPSTINGWCNFAMWCIMIVTLGNIIATFAQCGWGPCND